MTMYEAELEEGKVIMYVEKSRIKIDKNHGLKLTKVTG